MLDGVESNNHIPSIDRVLCGLVGLLVKKAVESQPVKELSWTDTEYFCCCRNGHFHVRRYDSLGELNLWSVGFGLLNELLIFLNFIRPCSGGDCRVGEVRQLCKSFVVGLG